MKDQFTIEGITYGKVSENELEKDINAFFNLGESGSFVQGKVYEIVIDYNSGNLDLNQIQVLDSNAPILEINAPTYRATIIDENNDVYDINFLVPNEIDFSPSSDWFDENGNQIDGPGEDDALLLSQVNFPLYLPFYDGADEIRIYDVNSNLKLTINASVFNSGPATLNYILGYGGNKVDNANYVLTYSILPQPADVNLTSLNYSLRLGLID